MSDQTTSTPTPAEPLAARDPEEVLPPRRRRKLRPLTAVLAAVVLVGVGFLGGVAIQKHYGASSSSSSAASSFAARFAARARAGDAGASAGGFFGGGAAGATGAAAGTSQVGQVTVIKGSTLYLANFLGNTIRVKIPPGVRVSETKSVTVRGIHPGDTVTAQATRLANGDYRATTITVTPSSGN